MRHEHSNRSCEKCNHSPHTLEYVPSNHSIPCTGVDLPAKYYKLSNGDDFHHCIEEHLIQTCSTCGYIKYTNVAKSNKD